MHSYASSGFASCRLTCRHTAASRATKLPTSSRWPAHSSNSPTDRSRQWIPGPSARPDWFESRLLRVFHQMNRMLHFLSGRCSLDPTAARTMNDIQRVDIRDVQKLMRTLCAHTWGILQSASASTYTCSSFLIFSSLRLSFCYLLVPWIHFSLYVSATDSLARLSLVERRLIRGSLSATFIIGIQCWKNLIEYKYYFFWILLLNT